MKKIEADWVVMGGAEGEVGHCLRCGVGFKVELPMRVEAFCELSNAFVMVHSHCKAGQYREPIPETVQQWREGRDTGTSSLTIYRVMTGGPADIVPHWNNPPRDPSDFGRCYRLLKLAPEWIQRLPEVAAKFPRWKPLVDNWAELTALYEEELPDDTAPRLYARMGELGAQK